MIRTLHFSSRMNQRGVTQEMVDLVLELGHQYGDRVTADRKLLSAHLKEVSKREKAAKRSGRKSPQSPSHEKKVALKILDKGGLVVVIQNKTLITTYNYESFRRSCHE